MDRYDAIKTEMVNTGCDPTIAADLAKEATRNSFDKSSNVSTLTSFTKDDGESSPVTFLHTLEGELDL